MSGATPSPGSLVVEQQAPTPERQALPAVWDLVIADMQVRDQEGRRRYGTPLQPHNGRKALVDVYQELLDAAVYLRQELYEREGSRLEQQLVDAGKRIVELEQQLQAVRDVVRARLRLSSDPAVRDVLFELDRDLARTIPRNPGSGESPQGGR